MCHRWITDEDEDLSEGRASEDIDQQVPSSIHVRDWLVCVEESAEEDVVVVDTVVETLLWRML
jgi:hypothetical protein